MCTDSKKEWVCAVIDGRWGTAAYLEADLPPVDKPIEPGDSRNPSIISGEIRAEKQNKEKV